MPNDPDRTGRATKSGENVNRRLTAVLTGACAALIMLAGAQAAGAAGKTVTITGKAYVFGHMDTPISNAPIKVREFPKLTATTDEIGDYKLKVPNEANVTPYIPSGEGLLTRRNLDDYSPKDEDKVQTHWNEIDLQTFHPRGQNLVNVNFQVPVDPEYAGLKAILSVQADPDGRNTNCAIVTTASVRNVRDVNYAKFESETARLHGHGVPGASAIGYPALGEPIYFTEQTIPLPTQKETSLDGGIVWTEVPPGTYRVVTTSKTDRFASFLATCKPRRVVNANPPWGAYQLTKGEKPLGASNVAGSVISAKATRKGKIGRYGTVVLKAGENLNAAVTLKAGGGAVTKSLKLKPGTRKVRVNVDFRRKWKKANMVVRLKDASGVSITTKKKIFLRS